MVPVPSIVNVAATGDNPVPYSIVHEVPATKVVLPLQVLDPISKLINARLVKQMSKQSIKVYPTTKLLDTIISSPASYGFDIVPSAGLTKYNCIDQVGNDAPLKKAACRSWVFVKTQHPTQHAGYCLFRSFDLWSDSTSVPTAPNVLKCNTPPK